MGQKISIIAPIYNAEKTLKRCIESLITQVYHNIEIILVDDGSRDGSLDLCKKYGNIDERIRIIEQTNNGVSAARNAGIEAAKGDYIMFCDSDDWVEPDWCDTMLMNFDSENFIMCGEYIEGEQKILPRKVSTEKKVKEKTKRAEFYSLKYKMFNVPWNKIFLKSIIDRNNIRFSEKLTNGEDLLFNVKYLSCIPGDIVLLNKCCYHYTWPNANSLSRNVPADYIGQCEFLLKNLKKLISKIGIMSKENMIKFYTDFFYEYQRAVLKLLSDKNISIFQRWNLGNRVMRSKEYQICVRNAKISCNSFFFYLNKMKICYPLWLWYCVRGMIKNND